MVRTRSFNPSQALSKAMDVFTAKGYSDTSMDDLVRATGVSRYGLYGTFGNKRELFEQALERYADRMGRQSFLRLLDADASLAQVRTIFAERIDAMCEAGEKRGCMLCHTAMQLAPHDHEIAEVLQKFIRRMSRAFSIGLEAAARRGELRGDVDTRAAGELLSSTLLGLAVLACAGSPRATLENVARQTIDSLAA